MIAPKTLLRIVCITGFIAVVTACTWVKPIPKSHYIDLVGTQYITNCVKKGTTKSKTLSKFVFIPRSNDKISLELVTLAKNEAVIMGGDKVVAESDLNGGGQVFGIYLCGNN